MFDTSGRKYQIKTLSAGLKISKVDLASSHGVCYSEMDFILVAAISATKARFYAPIPRTVFLPIIDKYWTKLEKQWLEKNPGKVFNKNEHKGQPSFGTRKHDVDGFPIDNRLGNHSDINLTKPITPAVIREFRKHFGLPIDAHDFNIDPTVDTMAHKIYNHLLQILLDDHLKN